MDSISHFIELKLIPFIKRRNLLSFILGAVDILAIAFAFQLSYFKNYFFTGGFFFSNKTLLFIFLAILPLWLFTLYILKATEIPRTKRYRVLFIEYMQSAVVIALLLLVFYFLFRNYNISRRFLVEFTFFGFLFLFLVRFFEYKVFKTYRLKGFNIVNIVLIADETSLPFIEMLRSYPEWGYRIMQIFSNSGLLNETYRGIYKIVPDILKESLQESIEADIIDEVLYIKDQVNPAEVRKTIRSCEEFGIVFRLMTKDRQPRLTNAFISIISNEKFLTFSNVPNRPFALAVKKFMDINISVLLLIILSPVMLITGLLIWLTSGSPILYRQARIGLRGRQFDLYKFRTMVVNADGIKGELESLNEMDGPAFKMKNDPRITKFGRFLRRSGLDELPQLINVLRGEMSLIGPRPPLREETKLYKRWQLRRLSVKPGLSCFWQIKPDRNSIKFEKWMELDLAYIDNWSPRLDFIILFKTIRTVFQRTGL
ncbi:MAG: sugar transferase [Bacteroidales bacterium]|nr:sugar transferase [Bacteroidales bacterium]